MMGACKMNFREWLAQNGTEYNKPWKASKEEVIKHWSGLTPGLPMAQVRIIPTGHKGPTLSYDGLRITGSSEFIDSIISRLKELLSYEGGNSRLNVLYKQQVDNKTQQAVPGSFAFYFHAKQRGKND